MLVFFNDTATTEIYTLSLHDALPILRHPEGPLGARAPARARPRGVRDPRGRRRVASPAGPRRPSLHPDPRADRKSTRLNSSHANISYAVFCLKKKQM